MAFVQAKCENCGAILTVDPSLKAAICDHCGGAYVVQDSINYYNSFTKVEHMHADVVNISDESSSEGRLKAADAFMKLKKYPEAKAEYEKVTALTPQNCHGWRGLINANTEELTKRLKYKTDFQLLEDYVRSVEAFDDGSCAGFMQSFREYLSSEREKNKEEKKQIEKQIANNEEKVKSLEVQKKELEASLTKVNKELSTVSSQVTNANASKADPSVQLFLNFTAGVFLFIGVVVFAYADHGFGIFFLVCGGLILAGVSSAKKKRERLNSLHQTYANNQYNLKKRIDEKENEMKQLRDENSGKRSDLRLFEL